MALVDINLNEAEQQQIKDKLDAWKLAEKKKLEEELTEKYEQMEAELKEQYEALVEEIKENMKKVYSKRFSKALKEMYEEIRAEVVMESMQAPEAKAMEEIKAAIYPFISEPTAKRHRDEFTKLASMYESTLSDLDLLKGQVKKAQLVESLSPDVRKVVTKLLGEGTEEEIVTKFAAIKEALKSQAEPAPAKSERRPVVEEVQPEEEVVVERAVDEDEPEEIVEDKKPVVDADFEATLHEQLVLAGLRKARR